MKLEFFPAAEQELLEAAKEYEAHLAGLGSDFLLEIERLASVLLELPSLGEKLDPIHRRVPLRRFPYALIFRRNGDIIRIVAVAPSPTQTTVLEATGPRSLTNVSSRRSETLARLKQNVSCYDTFSAYPSHTIDSGGALEGRVAAHRPYFEAV